MFPKAKIHRFNDNTSCAPPPGTYDPKLDAHIPNVVIPSSKRFPDQLFNSSSLECLKKSTTDLHDVVFRTPQPSRKRISKTPILAALQAKKFDTPGSSSSISSTKSEENLHLPTGSSSLKAITRADYNRLEQKYSALSDKFRCVTLGLNLEISKLKDELQEIKTHEAELNLILEGKNEQECERSKEVLELKENLDLFEQKLVEDRLSNKKYITDLETELQHVKEKREELEGIISTKESAITSISEKYNNLEDEIIKLKEDLEQKNEVILQIKETHGEMLESVISQSQEKIEELENKFCLKVQDLEREFDSKLEEKEVDFQTKLNYFSHDFNVKKNSIEKEMNDCILRVKELEDLVDKTTKGLTKDIDEANERCKLMFRELCKVELERDDLLFSDLEKKLSILEIQEKCDNYAEDSESFKEKCKKYEITLNSMRSTVQVLSTRLVESENEVERLCLVEIDLDTQKKLLEEKSQLLLADIMTLREGMARLEKDIVNDVAVQREHLAAKVEGYKAEVSRQVGYLNNQINEKQHAINMLLQENDYFKNESKRKDSHIKELRYKVKQYKEDIIQLKTSFSKLEDDFNEKLSAQKNLYKILNDKLMRSTDIIDDLTALKINHDVTIASLLQKNETYQQEVLRVDKELDLLKTNKIEQEGEISSLKTKIEMNQKKLQNHEAVNAKQQQYIDGLVSDLVLEKERCVVLENEKEMIKKQLSLVEIDFNGKLEEIESLKSKLYVVEANLRTAEDNLSANSDAKAELESKLLAYQNKENEYAFNSQIQFKQLEKKNADLQASLNSAKEKIKIEIPKLEHDNINKAEYILELSLTIDSLKEEIHESQTKATSLEVEKADLSLQLEQSENTISNLNEEISNMHTQINFLQVESEGFSCQLEDFNYEIANLKEEVDQKETKIACLEAEKAGMSLQLDEANYTIANLRNETTINENANAMVISQLKDQIKAAGEREGENYKTMETLQTSLQKHTELLKTSANCEIELTNAQAEINMLQDALKMKNRDIEIIEKNYAEKINSLLSQAEKEDIEADNNLIRLEMDVATLKSEKEELEKKLRAVTEERDKLEKDITDLVGHHNNLQRIRHVQSLKQVNIELKEEKDKLSQENIRLKAQLQEFKENSHTPRVNDTPRPPLKVKSAKKLASPGVLKEWNH